MCTCARCRIGQDVSPGVIARGTPGMSGADLANLCNEAALMAARRSARTVEMQDFEKAKDKILHGPRAQEHGHDRGREAPQYRVSRVWPCTSIGRDAAQVRPGAQGHHHAARPRAGRDHGSLPAQDRYSYDREFMLSQISMLFGGRIAEEVFMNQMIYRRLQRLRTRHVAWPATWSRATA